ncbi:hypothetical protein HN695_07150 [Candidatus Woesearchaeota archaeon]|jgi:hypothetical protein|nr:hypothetical protein [Candidatus Woesearchaeota archaeon]MBT6040972.1 hypothetical protein [Candidatus Woesearchaeota archaeon]MBT6336138.1 hypothetical protein [Candidatus Woesearchaeota archaeon]MBT7928083.1 hypothetical protein [Candidatus Woesearchaeota archaeon]
MKHNILKELKHHTPFTFIGAISGIVIMLLFYKIPAMLSSQIFYVLHPMHVILSALVTASIYKKYSKKVNPLLLIFVGYMGSVGIATISDSIIPYIGEIMFNLPNPGLHLGFIEKWWLVNPLAFLGIAIAYFNPTTKFPHAGHVLLSTWASLFHIMMALGGTISPILTIIIFIFLFIAVLVPCCLSDIIFPLLFVKGKSNG